MYECNQLRTRSSKGAHKRAISLEMHLFITQSSILKQITEVKCFSLCYYLHGVSSRMMHLIIVDSGDTLHYIWLHVKTDICHTFLIDMPSSSPRLHFIRTFTILYDPAYNHSIIKRIQSVVGLHDIHTILIKGLCI